MERSLPSAGRSRGTLMVCGPAPYSDSRWLLCCSIASTSYLHAQECNAHDMSVNMCQRRFNHAVCLNSATPRWLLCCSIASASYLVPAQYVRSAQHKTFVTTRGHRVNHAACFASRWLLCSTASPAPRSCMHRSATHTTYGCV
jgi:hypothetical protein